MKSRAIFFLLMYSRSFNPEKSSNAFAYCTQIAKNAFRQVIKKENRHAETKKNFVEEFFRNVDYSKHQDNLLG
jgi:predicted solute-binding protein